MFSSCSSFPPLKCKGQFILPAAVAGAIPPAVVGGGMKGLGAGTSMRRVGRLR